MHAMKKRIRWPYVVVAWLAAVGLMGLVPASADVTIDVSGQSLNFNKALPSAGSVPSAPSSPPGSPALNDVYDEAFGANSIIRWKYIGNGTWDMVYIYQADQDGNSDLDIGEDFAVGNYIDYFDVLTTAGTQIDARITVLAQESSVGASAGLVDKVDDANSDPGYNRYIQTDLDFGSNSGSAYVEFKIEFFTDLATGSPVPVTLQNVVFNTYDIDAEQYFEASNFARYSLGTDSFLEVSTVSDRTRFADPDNSDSNAENSDSRVQLEFDTLSTATYRLGSLSTSSSSNSYYLDFSGGLSWGGNQGADVISPVLAEQSPAIRSVTYEGPIGLYHSKSSQCAGGTAIVKGKSLDTVKAVLVSGSSVPFEILADGSLSYSLDGVAAGRYAVKFWVEVNNVYLTDSISVTSCATSNVVGQPATDGTPFYAHQLFANYRGDLGLIASQDVSAITSFINKYSGIKKVTCVGSTSGVPAIETDQALAQARASNACDIIRKLAPDAQFTLKTSTGKGVGQLFRSVHVHISG